MLLPELALALKTESANLVERIHKRHAVFSATDAPPQELPWEEVGSPEKVPRIAGLDPLGSVEFSEAILVGERADWFGEPDSGIAQLKVKAGEWYAYQTEDNPRQGGSEEDEDSEPARWLVMLHADAIQGWPHPLQKTAVVEPKGRRLQLDVVDLAVTGKTDVMDAVRYLGGTNVYYRRAVTAAAEELPTVLPVSTAGPVGMATAIVVPLNQAATEHSPRSRSAR